MAKFITSPTKLLKSKGPLVVLGIVLLALLVWAVIAVPGLLQPLLITLVVVAVGWLGVHFGLKAWRNRKQDAFDDAVTAKEGIDDRKREWASWSAELKKQGIDRYDLPFYLLLGEPQSGKSVLLQNSDLHFPFGQTRLSGVGGTRGCDWWFTEEAVILDLAGRLFTHEGGAADQMEWESFLDLLYDYRPLSPASGVLLVIPCDGLMRDTPDESAEKANKIQHALLTLTKKLQAQIPIYLVLTKGDQVFGFAECAHRLDAVKRQEMFGWSREAERLEAPFDLEEARQGFGEIVDRARVLCSEMLASARIPEALGEVDRMIVFPEELAGIWTNLEAYLKRIFTESGLVDRLYFRGMYLTSGLQSGVPVARLCADLLGGAGTADQQDLAGLFTKQRAYFIKDLVRKRVFSERGLVRPTEGRVVKARRNALIGYGASALIAVASIVGAIVHLASGQGDEAAILDQAIASVESMRVDTGSRGERDLRAVLGVLRDVDDAVSAERSTMEDTFASTRAAFRELFVEVFDREVVPRVRGAAVEDVAADLASEPASFDAMAKQVELTTILLGELDLDNARHVDALLGAVPASQQTAVLPSGLVGEDDFDLRTAIRKRRDYGDEKPLYWPRSESLGDLVLLARRALQRWDGVLTPGSPYQAGGEVGYLVALMGVQDAERVFDSRLPSEDPDLLRHCQIYTRSADRLDEIYPALEQNNKNSAKIAWAKFKLQLSGLESPRAPIAAFLAARDPGGALDDWPVRAALERFAEQAFSEGAEQALIAGGGGQTDAGRLLVEAASSKIGGALASLDVRNPELTRDEDVSRACKFAPAPDWQPSELAAKVREALDFELVSLSPTGRIRKADTMPGALVLACLSVTGTEFRDRYRHWSDLPGAAGGQQLDTELVQSLAELRAELLPYTDAVRGADEWISGIETVLLEHLEAVREGWATDIPGNEIDWDLHASLTAAQVTGRGGGRAMPAVARELAQRYLDHHHRALLDVWRNEYPDTPDGTTALLEAIAEQFATLDNKLPAPADLEDDELFVAWRERVDDLVAERLLLIDEGLRENWGVPTERLDGSLRTAAIEINKMMAVRKIKDRVAAALELGAGALDRPVFDPEAKVYEQLPASAERLLALSAFVSPTPSSFEDLKFVENKLTVLVDELRGMQSEPGRRVADLLASLKDDSSTRDAPQDAGEYFAYELYDALYGRAIQDLRRAVVAELERLMTVDYQAVLTALYVTEFEELKDLASADLDMAKQLAGLIDRGKSLDTLRKDYRIGTGPDDPNALPGLRPTEQQLRLDDDRAWWAFETFLGELQTFLLGTSENLAGAKVDIGLKPVVGAEIWDISEGVRETGRWGAYYAPRNEKGKWEWQNIDEDMPETILEWGLRPQRGKSIRMRWSEGVDENPKWISGDASLELPGILAPFLLAWAIGERESDGWALEELQPRNSKWTAPFKMRFVGRDLPDRPEKPR